MPVFICRARTTPVHAPASIEARAAGPDCATPHTSGPDHHRPHAVTWLALSRSVGQASAGQPRHLLMPKHSPVAGARPLDGHRRGRRCKSEDTQRRASQGRPDASRLPGGEGKGPGSVFQGNRHNGARVQQLPKEPQNCPGGGLQSVWDARASVPNGVDNTRGLQSLDLLRLCWACWASSSWIVRETAEGLAIH